MKALYFFLILYSSCIERADNAAIKNDCRKRVTGQLILCDNIQPARRGELLPCLLPSVKDYLACNKDSLYFGAETH